MDGLPGNLATAFLLPPLNFLVLLAVGTALLHTAHYAALGRRLLWLTIGAFYLFCTPLVGQALVASLQTAYRDPDLSRAQAIVVLGGGVHAEAPEYGRGSVSASTLERLRYAAHLQRLTDLPLLASGGRPQGGEAESIAMWETLRRDFGVDTRWVEITSRNTEQCARNSYAILQPWGLTRILLVTHAWHMPRARAAFAKAGFSVIPAPTVFVASRPLSVLDFLPSAKGLLQSRTALREWLGLGWYWLRGLV